MNLKLLGSNKKENFLTEIFENRGIPFEDLAGYLHTTDEQIYEPKLLDNIAIASAIVYRHIQDNSEIAIIVDSDVDGYTSSAIIWNFLREISPDANLKYINHGGKQHGIYKELVDDLGSFDLLIVPDAGSNDFEMHKYIRSELKADVVVLDHHDAERYSEDAIVVNSQLSENYPNKMLSGAGIAWQFIRQMNNQFDYGVDVDRFLDLVGLGNVADMMSLKSLETKHLINKGFRNVNNPMFKAFVEKQSYSMKGKVNPKTVGWYVGPLINAMVRVGTTEEKNRMFEGFLEENQNKTVPSTKRGAKEGDTENLCEHVARVAGNVRNRQQKVVTAGMDLIRSTIEEEELQDNQVLIVEVPDGSIEPELIGLVANKIANEYQKPTAIVRSLGKNLMGSIRNHGYSPLEDFRGELVNSGLVNWSRGHASAAGLSLPSSNKDSVVSYFNKKMEGMNTDPVFHVDFIFDMGDERDVQSLESCLRTISDLNDKGLWGQDLPEPKIAVKGLNVAQNVELLSPDKRPTLKIDVGSAEAIKFGSSAKEYESLHSTYGVTEISLVGTANVNEWNGAKTYQIMIDKYKVDNKLEYRF